MSERVVRRIVPALLAALVICVPQGFAGELRDPTRPDGPVSETPAAPAARFEVTAIFYSAERRVAVLNGRTVVEGDSVDGARVLGIGRRTLELEYRGRTVTASLPGARVRAGRGET